MPSEFSYSVTHISEPAGEITIDESSDPPFDPTLDYFLVISHQNCPMTRATITVMNDGPTADAGTDGAVEPDAGPQNDAAPLADAGSGDQDATDNTQQAAAPASTDDGGCGCRTAGRAPVNGGVVISLLAAAVALLRRRRTHGAAADCAE